MPRELTQFKKGASGNPQGRPKGSRNKLSLRFLSDIEKHWRANGKDVLNRICELEPAAYLRIVAGLISKEAYEDQPDNREGYESARDKLIRKIAHLTGQKISD